MRRARSFPAVENAPAAELEALDPMQEERPWRGPGDGREEVADVKLLKTVR